MTRPTIYLLPGLGTDRRMFDGPWRRLPNHVVLEWPKGGREKSIAAVAARLVEEAGIDDGAVLVGMSLGGVVACEIAKIRQIDRIFLISSAKKKEEVRLPLRLLHPLAGLGVVSLARAFCRMLPRRRWLMFSDSDPNFVRNMCFALFQWKGYQETSAKVFRLHGRNDWMISAPGESEATLIDGDHLIIMKQPETCVQFVESNLTG